MHCDSGLAQKPGLGGGQDSRRGWSRYSASTCVCASIRASQLSYKAFQNAPVRKFISWRGLTFMGTYFRDERSYLTRFSDFRGVSLSLRENTYVLKRTDKSEIAKNHNQFSFFFFWLFFIKCSRITHLSQCILVAYELNWSIFFIIHKFLL